jgi:hypothetical protein
MYLNQPKPNTCPTGNCPPGIEILKKVALTPREKRAVFFALKEEIFKQKRLRRELLA